MKILANRKIKFLFCSILSCILVFVLISTVLVNLDVRNTVYYIIFCSVCMGAAILLFCYGYFKEQHKIMENAISQITEYISGNKEVTIECNDEGELYRLFHEVNSLVAILNAHAENEKSAKKFLRNTISDISHQLKTPLAALNIYNGIIQGEAKELPTIQEFSQLSEQELDRISSEDETNSVDRNLAEDISEIPGVKSVFGTKLHVAYPVEINGNAGTVDLFSYDESMLDSFKKSVMSGDLSKVYGNSGYALAIYNQDNRLNVGDKIKIGDTEIEIACIASEGVGSVSGAATMVCSEETYTQLTGEQDYALVSVVLEKNISETEVSKIRNLSSDYVFADNRAENSDVNGSYWVFRLAAYGFLAIISFITILNIMNSISMSVSARIKQYGAMRAVGMGNRQITKMITAEAITYAACGTIIGFVLGLLLHYLIYVKIIVTHFGGTWKVPVVPMEIIVLLVLVSCILAVYAPAKRIRNMAITATINEL